MAKAAGYPNTHRFADLESLEGGIKEIMNQAGPTLVNLIVAPSMERPPYPLIRTPDIISRFREALKASAPQV
jgi:hypothetical protein